MRIGIFGGSFDPVHRGHLALGRAAVRELKLDRLYIVPAWSPPHKKRGSVSPASERLRLLRKAWAKNSRFRIHDWELRRKGTSYSYKTLNHFQKLHPGGEFFLILGEDSLRNFPTWRRWRSLLRRARLVTGRRPGTARRTLPRAVLENTVFLKTRMPDISSTEIRRKASRARPIGRLVPPGVAKEIHAMGIYR